VRRLAGYQEVRTRRTETRSRFFEVPTVPTEHLRRECNTREPGHQGSYLTDNSELRPCVDDGGGLADSANHHPRRVAKCGVRGKNANARVNKRRQNQEPRGRGGQRPQREETEDGCVTLLGRRHQGRPEAEDTLTMISRGVGISIAGGGAGEEDVQRMKLIGQLYM